MSATPHTGIAMGSARTAAALGEPDLEIAGLQVWVHSQPHVDSGESYDADWLVVTAHCGAADASVWASGAILTASAFDRFAEGCDQLYARLEGAARLASDEPNLTAQVLATDRLGHVRMLVEITPDHMTQQHRFEFELDQSYLPDVVRQCRAVLGRYPNPHASR